MRCECLGAIYNMSRALAKADMTARLLKDKTEPNYIQTVLGVLVEQAEAVSVEELEYRHVPGDVTFLLSNALLCNVSSIHFSFLFLARSCRRSFTTTTALFSTVSLHPSQGNRPVRR